MSLIDMSSQFSGLPMGELISGPLNAVSEAQTALAKGTANFIREVGFDVTADDDGNETSKPKILPFKMKRMGQNDDGSLYEDEIDMNVPLLACVDVPNMQIDEADIEFNMEVKSSESSSSSSDSEGSFEGKASYGFGLFKVSTKITGKTSSHRESTRSSDNSAKYSVKVRATNHGMPEGLARVMDIYAESADKPSKITRRKIKDDGTVDEDSAVVNPDQAAAGDGE